MKKQISTPPDHLLGYDNQPDKGTDKELCKECEYEINPAGICINMNCSTNENP